MDRRAFIGTLAGGLLAAPLAAGRVEQDIRVNQSEFFAPVIEPTLCTGTQTLVIAALAYLAK
jgi:hippurate hydrolase